MTRRPDPNELVMPLIPRGKGLAPPRQPTVDSSAHKPRPKTEETDWEALCRNQRALQAAHEAQRA